MSNKLKYTETAPNKYLLCREGMPKKGPKSRKSSQRHNADVRARIHLRQTRRVRNAKLGRIRETYNDGDSDTHANVVMSTGPGLGPGPGPDPDQPVFVILGHGTETVELDFDAREKVPEGYTLVTMAECGDSIYLDSHVDPLIRVATNKEVTELLRDPVKNKTAIESLFKIKIHIYKSGMKMPPANITLLTEWVAPDSKHMRIFKSGVFQLPLNPATFREFSKEYDNATMDVKLSSKTIRELRERYDGSVFPRAKDFDFDTYFYRFANSVTYSLSDILAACHPGVYYMLSCRVVRRFGTPYSRAVRSVQHNRRVPDEIKTMLNADIGRLYYHLPRIVAAARDSSNFSRAPNILQRLHDRITVTRKKSANQQEQGHDTTK